VFQGKHDEARTSVGGDQQANDDIRRYAPRFRSLGNPLVSDAHPRHEPGASASHCGEGVIVSRRKVKTSVKGSDGHSKALHVEVKPFGPEPSEVAQLAQRLQWHKAVRKLLDKTRYRLLSVELLDADNETKATKPTPPSASAPPSTTTRTIVPYSLAATSETQHLGGGDLKRAALAQRRRI